MKILKSWLQKHIEETLPCDEIIEQALILKSSEVEVVEKIKLAGKDDTVFDIKVLPDRAHYMLSHRGVAYDLCAVLNLTLKKENMEIPEKGNDVSIKVESDICTRYNATLIKNINNTKSPNWLKDSLEAIGARSINAIVDTANYAMFDTGQPLHAFDADKVVGGITVRFAKEGEVLETLDSKNIESKGIPLKLHHFVIADDHGPLALAGIKGGKRAEVDSNTKNIILESADFNPVSVRKTSFEVGIRNDASKRYENEITAHLTEKGTSRFLDIIENISPSCEIGNMNDVYKKLPEHWTIKVSHENIESILNFKIVENRIIEILEKLQCKVSIINGVYEVIPPYERLDLIITEDIIDEIGRIEGLDKVKSVLPSAKNSHENAHGFLITEKVKDFFVSKGFNEIQTRTFASEGAIEVAYPLASDKAFLRTSLEEGVLEAIKSGEKNAPLLGMEKIQIFEVGKAFPKSGEQLDACFAISYVKKIKDKDNVIKTESENLINELEKELGIKLNASISSNCVSIKGLEKSDIKLDLSSIDFHKSPKITFRPFSNEPFIVRDIAVFVQESFSSDDVWKVIESGIEDAGAKDLLVRNSLFDTFKKEGKVSYAFRMVFQSMDRTLTDEEVNGIMEKINSQIKENGWEVR